MRNDIRSLVATTVTFVAMLVGCDRTTLKTVESVTSADGNNRLLRKDWETSAPSRPNEKSYDSHSLIWQRLKNGVWTDHVTISKDDFQRGSQVRRWISSIHHFDPASATAILKIAEGNAPENSGAVSYVYSWRVWDIKNNREIKTVRVCDDPFETYSNNSSETE